MRKRQLKNNRGFSLLELSVILFIVMILLGIAMPRFPRLFESDLQLEAQKIARLIFELRQQAILNSEKYQLVIDTHKSRYSVLTSSADRPGEYVPHAQYGEPIPLADTITFPAVSRLENADENNRYAGPKITFDKIFGQQFQIIIDSSGFIDPFTVWLRDRSSQLSLSIVDIMGRVKISDEKSL